MNAYEEKKAEKLLEWAVQKVNTELEALKQILLSIMRDVINQKSHKALVDNLINFLQQIAMTAMAINTPSAQEDKPQQISLFIVEREKLFQKLRHNSQLKAEHHSLFENK